jgi:hypothetical protein
MKIFGRIMITIAVFTSICVLFGLTLIAFSSPKEDTDVIKCLQAKIESGDINLILSADEFTDNSGYTLLARIDEITLMLDDSTSTPEIKPITTLRYYKDGYDDENQIAELYFNNVRVTLSEDEIKRIGQIVEEYKEGEREKVRRKFTRNCNKIPVILRDGR